jgi:hypothetical protein
LTVFQRSSPPWAENTQSKKIVHEIASGHSRNDRQDRLWSN